MKKAKIIKVETVGRDGQIQVHVKCPICEDKHIHGCGTTRRPLEVEGATKMSHCLLKETAMYELTHQQLDHERVQQR
jgi:hypothetical protein